MTTDHTIAYVRLPHVLTALADKFTVDTHWSMIGCVCLDPVRRLAFAGDGVRAAVLPFLDDSLDLQPLDEQVLIPRSVLLDIKKITNKKFPLFVRKEHDPENDGPTWYVGGRGERGNVELPFKPGELLKDEVYPTGRIMAQLDNDDGEPQIRTLYQPVHLKAIAEFALAADLEVVEVLTPLYTTHLGNDTDGDQVDIVNATVYRHPLDQHGEPFGGFDRGIRMLVAPMVPKDDDEE